MSNANDLAFPIDTDRGLPRHPGLTKREYFAAMAMQGVLSGYEVGGDQTDEIIACIAKESVAAADALLSELERTK